MKKHIGQYTLLSLLGTGGMSEVYLAQDTKTGTKVALKILDKKLSKDEDYIKRFKREIEISKTLSHPNIVKIISYGTDKGRYYIVYEYIEGLTLDRYTRSKRLSISEIEDITLKILQGLSYAHSKGIIHRDIKPSNIMISKDRDVKIKILDFGIARAITRSTITKTGMFMGSPHYSSPEQIRGRKIDNRTDIYSLGIVLYEMIVGKVPFDSEEPWGITRAHIDDKVPKIVKRVPPYLKGLIYRCLAKDPSNRFSSSEEISEIIKQKSYVKETIIKPTELRKPKEAKRGLSEKKIAAIALGSIAIVVIIVVSIILGLNYASRRQIAESEVKEVPTEEVAEEPVKEVEPPPSEDTEEPPEPDPIDYDTAKVGAVIEVIGEFPSTLYINTDNIIEIKVTNTSDFTWKATSPDKVTIGYHYYGQDVEFVDYDSTTRTELPKDISPGETVSLKVLIDDIPGEGTYIIEIDPVLEGYYWFSSKDVPPLEKEVVFITKGGEAPTVSLKIYEGPVPEGDICYYRIEAEVTGKPNPSVEFSRDDSNEAYGQKKAQINLMAGDSYTLIVTATNKFGQDSDSIVISWGCDEDRTAEPATEEKAYDIGGTGPAGGLIFYINPNYKKDGWHYLEAAPYDQSSANIQWYNGRYIKTGAQATGVGTGEKNTKAIIDAQGLGNYAARICYDLELGGYSDWFLPSKDELNLMYEKLCKKGLGGFEAYYYWSSTEYHENGAWIRDFAYGGQNYNDKYDYQRVRAVRAF